MSKTPPAQKESRNWYKDRYQAVVLQRRLLMLITMLSMFSTLGSVFYIAHVTPLKSVEPFVIQVDPKSGITQTVDPLTVEQITGVEAVNNYFIVQYVRARESFNMLDIKRNYPTVAVMSDRGSVYPQFIHESRPDNPQSNTARLGTTGTRTVKIKSISYLKSNKGNTAQARLLIEETAANGGTVQYHKIATITFEYIKLALTTEERYINPLGFQVTEYRLDDDALPK